MQDLHCSPFSGHLGLKRTLLKAKEQYFWPHMTTLLQDFVKNCQVCAQIKLDPNHIKAPLQSITVNEPFIFWAMDYMGPLPETTQGKNKHLLVIMDHFTKWCEVFPTKDQKARTVAEILVSKVSSRFGPPTVIHFGQGRNFESNLMHEICCLMGVHINLAHQHTTLSAMVLLNGRIVLCRTCLPATSRNTKMTGTVGWI